MNKINKVVDEWLGKVGEGFIDDSDVGYVRIYGDEIVELKKSLRKVIEDEIDDYFESKDLFFKMVEGTMTSCNTDIQEELIQCLLGEGEEG